MFLSLSGFMILFCLRLIVSLRITDSEILHGPFRNVIDVFFIFSLICLTKIIEIRNNAMGFIGKVSYEIYLIHPIVIYILRDKIFLYEGLSVITFLSTIGLAWLLHTVNNSMSGIIRFTNR